jgi:hypothetical protein
VDLKFQSSFIPKQPIVPPSGQRGTRANLFSLLATVVFIVVVGLVGAEIIAEYVLNRSLAVMDARIVEEQNSFELSTIEDLRREDGRLRAVKDLLGGHLVFSQFLELLSQSTYERVNYTELTYNRTSSGVIEISLIGVAEDFNALALQANLLRNVPGVNNPLFSDFKIDEGGVGFTTSFTLSSEVILYKNYIASGGL